MNLDNYKMVLDTIKRHPDQWDQTNWHGHYICRTTHCFAGWAQILSGREECGWRTRKDAMDWLGLEDQDAIYLFHSGRTLGELETFYVQHKMAEVFDRSPHHRLILGWNEADEVRSGALVG